METLSRNTEAILLGFTYYKNLSPPSRRRFVERLEEFIKEKEFEGREGLEVTEEMKVLITASAIQLTFGLSSYKLKHFSRILIYPDKFYSPFSRSANVGEANPNGILVFSWKAIKDGLEDDHDSKNVALHELAHAINLSDEMGVTTGFFHLEADPVFSNYFDRWYAVVRKLLKNHESEEVKFFRKYAGKNLHEFFAVATEYFFEMPQEYKTALPDLYHHHCCLLGQDPLNKDYKLIVEKTQSSKALQTYAFINKINPQGSKVGIGIGIGIFSMCVVYLMTKVIAIAIIFGAMSIIGMLVSSKKICNIEVADGKLKAKEKGLFFDNNYAYPIENILSVKYSTDSESDSYISVVLYEMGKVKFEAVKVYHGLEDYLPLFNYLFHTCDIVVKNQGKIFIP